MGVERRNMTLPAQTLKAKPLQGHCSCHRTYTACLRTLCPCTHCCCQQL